MTQFIAFFLLLIRFLMPFFAFRPIYAVLPYPLFELPINDQPECVDYSNDCPDRRGLCKNEAFKEIMRSTCPKSCRICGEIVKEIDDYDQQPVNNPPVVHHQRHINNNNAMSLNPSVIKEWSKFLAYNVDNDLEENNNQGIMMNVDANKDLDTEEYAVLSDEYLSESNEHHQSSTILPPSAILQPPPSFPLPPSIADHNIPPTFHRRKPCLDHAPNCFYLKSLCHNKFYSPIMKTNCQHKKTESHGKTRWNGISKRPLPSPHSWHVNGPIQNEHCRNRGLDCDEKIKWCTHWRYWKFMRRICAASCGFCDANENDY